MGFLVSIYSVVLTVTEIGLAIIVPFGLVAIIARSTRRAFSKYLVYLSYPIGFTTWVLCAIATLNLWGTAALVIGILFLGVGVLPMAILAALFHGAWSVVGTILFQMLLLYGTRFGGIAVGIRDDARRERDELAAFS